MGEEVIVYPLEVVAALFGSLVGSFLNVVALRTITGESLSHPPSHCPRCLHPIRWFDNIPLFSWLLLVGKCRDCRGRISPAYPITEAVTALWAGAVVSLGLPFVPSLLHFGAGASLIAAARVDFATTLLPRKLLLFSLGSLLLLALAEADSLSSLGWRLQGVLVVAGALALVRFLFSRWMGREAMGGGDVELGVVIGFWLGAAGGGLALGVAVVTGAGAGAIWAWISHKEKDGGVGLELPWGPFLVGGAFLSLLGGETLQTIFETGRDTLLDHRQIVLPISLLLLFWMGRRLVAIKNRT